MTAYRGEIADFCRGVSSDGVWAKEVVANKGIHAEVEYITDMEKIMGYGVMSMPALMVDDKIVSAEKVLKAKEVEKLL